MNRSTYTMVSMFMCASSVRFASTPVQASGLVVCIHATLIG